MKHFIEGLLCIILPLVVPPLAQAAPQDQHEVAGIVVDASGQPLIGAGVMELGNESNGVVTNLDGKFAISVPANATLIVTNIGYKDTRIQVAGQGYVTILMEEDTELLDQVVVVGYGTQKKATLTGSISQVAGDDLKKVSAANLTNTLAGKTAGIIANTRSGEPGADDADILIRGKGTLGNNSPLIVVDGIADRSFSRLNPEDIESISVLKDASAAIYGARAANGVILVTTKRGREGKVQVSYSGSYTMSQPTKVPEMLNAYEYGTYINEYDRQARNQQGGITYSDEVLAHYKNHDDPLNYPDTDWWDAVTKDWAGRTEHSLSVSGGNENVSFYTSMQYMYQDAIYKNSAENYNQYQFMANLDAKISKAIGFSLDILGRQEVRNAGARSTEDIYTYFLSTFPGSAPYYPNGLPRVGYDGTANNAALMVTDEPGWSKTTSDIVNIKPLLHIDLGAVTPGLYAEGYAALDFNFKKNKTLTRPFDVYYYDNSTGEYINYKANTGTIGLTQYASDDSTVMLHARVGYERTFNDVHHVSAFVAYEQSKYKYDYLYGSRDNYLSDQLADLFAGSANANDKDNDGTSNVITRQNYFGRVNYEYADKYLAEFTLRYDGSMNFAPGHQWGLFPAVSLGWVVSQEPFWQKLSETVSFFKLKGSWGEMGNDNIDAYQYLSQYGFTEYAPYFGAGSDGNETRAFEQLVIANPSVTWETAKTLNLGFNTSFFHGLFGLDFDWFLSKRSDILCTRSASRPYYTGGSLPAENIGKVTSHGVEIIANYRDHSGDFSWGATGNFTYATNKVDYMDEAENTPEWQRTTGHPIDGQVMYKALGIYQTQEEVDSTPHIAGAEPGDLIYQDTNGDGEITWDDAIRVNTTPTPKIIYGLTLNGEWKGLDFTMFFQGQAMAKQLVQPTMNMAKDFYEGRYIESESAEYNAAARWPKALIKQTYINEWNQYASTWWLRNAAFLRLKSVEVGYTLPQSLTRKARIEKARVYVNGGNLFTIDNYGIGDPETGVDSEGNQTNGIKAYPLQRTITFGVNVIF